MTESNPQSGYANRVRLMVRAVLDAQGVSATEVAKRCGWKQSYLARRLTRTRPVALSMADLEAIAAALNLHPTALLPDLDRVPA